MSDKLICSKCYKSVHINSLIICEICRCKFHRICAKVDDEAAFNTLNNFENIIYNCDNCLISSRDLIKTISLLSFDIQQLKTVFSQFMKNNANNNNKLSSHHSVPMLKTGFNSNVHTSKSAKIKTTAAFESVSAKEVDTITNKFITQVNDSAVTAVNDLNNDSLIVTAVNNDNNEALIDNHVSCKNSMGLNNTTAVIDLSSDNNGLNNSISSQPVSNINTADLNADDENNNWNNVTRRKKNSYNPRIVVGDNDNSELEVAFKMKWVHLSAFKPTVSEQNIISYVKKHLCINNGNISCFKLVKKDASTSHLKFVNFKLGVPANYYEQLFRPDFWTSAIKVRPFKFFPKTKNQQQQT